MKNLITLILSCILILATTGVTNASKLSNQLLATASTVDATPAGSTTLFEDTKRSTILDEEVSHQGTGIDSENAPTDVKIEEQSEVSSDKKAVQNNSVEVTVEESQNDTIINSKTNQTNVTTPTKEKKPVMADNTKTSKTKVEKIKGKLESLNEDNVIIEHIPAKEKFNKLDGFLPKVTFLFKTFSDWLNNIADSVL